LIKLLIVDDSALVRKLLGEVFATDDAFSVQFAKTGMEALVKIAAFDPDVVTLDVNMPEMDGLTCLDRIMLETPRPVVMVSSLTNAGADATLEAMRLGAVDVIAKPSGAVSLDIHDLAPALVAKVKSAASAKVAGTRLKERVRQKTAGSLLAEPVRTQTPVRKQPVKRLSGSGVVVIGVSTGGPPALEKVLVELDAKFGWPIVIAQHMPATFTGALARRLDKLTALTVSEVQKVTPVEVGHVYVARGNADIVLSARPAGVVAMPAPAKEGYLWQPSVDRLVRTAMESFAPEQIVGVMLTGMGNDGAAAMTELRNLGGHVIAESEESAVVWGMPGEVVKAGGANWIVPVGDVGGILARLVPSCR
jgi:two-component system chemotaxis response regulator CheB